MRQLTGQDSNFIFMEAANSPLHLTSIYIYDPSTAPGGKITHKQLLQHINERIHTSSVFTQRLRKVPMNLDFPYWVDDPNLDIEFHVRHIGLPSPRDWRQLCILVSRLHARPLDLSRPPWEMYIIEGLDNVEGVPAGSFAILSKYHHAAIDGASGTEIVSALHDTQRETAARPAVRPQRPDAVPADWSLLMKAGLNNIRRPFHLASVLSASTPKLASLWQKKDDAPASLAVPKTRFNNPVSPYRVFTGVEFSLDDFKKIRRAVDGVTINDIVLAICAGGLRSYLQHHDELPDTPLVSAVPINTRTEADKDVTGNVVSMMLIKLQTQIEDPLERLQSISDITRREKTMEKAVSARQMTDINLHLPAATLAMAGRLITATGLAYRTKPVLNVVITNVPGPQIPLYLCGAELLQTWGCGPVMDGMGLIVSAHSYNGKLFLCAGACREIMPDPARFSDCLQASFAALKITALPKQTKPRHRKAASKSKTTQHNKKSKHARKQHA